MKTTWGLCGAGFFGVMYDFHDPAARHCFHVIATCCVANFSRSTCLSLLVDEPYVTKQGILRMENSAEISKRFVLFAFLHLICIEVHPFVGQSSSFSQLFCRRHRTELRFADHKEHLGHRQSPNLFRCSD